MQNNENFAENPNFENTPLIRVELNEEGRQVVSGTLCFFGGKNRLYRLV
jgi:hypothetical protein